MSVGFIRNGKAVKTAGNGGGLIPVYVVGSTPYDPDWLSLTEGGEAFSPTTNKTYVIVSDDEYKNKILIFDGEYYSNLKAEGSGSGGSGTSDYRDLTHKPTINGKSLNGNLTLADLGISEGVDPADYYDKSEVDNALSDYYDKSEVDNALSDYYDKSEVESLISAAATGGFEAVSSLPLTDISTKKIYLVPKAEAEGADNIYDEFIFIDGDPGHWERIGSTRIDLTNYVTTSALNAALSSYYTESEVDQTIDDAFAISASDIANAANSVFNPSVNP